MPRWEAVCLPGVCRSNGDRERSGLLAGGALIPVVAEPLLLRRHCPGQRKLQGRISFKRPLEKPQKIQAKAEAKFEPEPEPPQMEAPQHAVLGAGEGDSATAPRDEELQSPLLTANSASKPTDLVASTLRSDQKSDADWGCSGQLELQACAAERKQANLASSQATSSVRMFCISGKLSGLRSWEGFGSTGYIEGRHQSEEEDLCQKAAALFGLWRKALARCIAKLRPEAGFHSKLDLPRPPKQMPGPEVVAVRPLEMELLDLAEGPLQSRRRYATCGRQPLLHAVVRIATMRKHWQSASLNTWRILGRLCVAGRSSQCVPESRPLTSSTDPPRVVAAEGKVFPPRVDRLFNLREVVPRELRRVFAWPGRLEPVEAQLRPRQILRPNPGPPQLEGRDPGDREVYAQ
ncbi:unnamed protein product [Symbiodinium necroappetens]|uniref:Uncharacterized protein n=1 Tax=Symbiodinium necroappetens TaxID=1628268 RepID=A0A813ALY6_9DINO|nr:unnamed protein product [Symbiodinium necroappetens]